MKHIWSVFTKPWRDLSPEELGQLVSRLGFDGIEFPLRAGYQVEPKNAEKELPRLAAALARHHVVITSVAPDSPTEAMFAACQAAGVKLLRIMMFADPTVGWMKSIDQKRRELEKLIPLSEKYGVTVGVQNHYGFAVFNTMEMRYLLRDFDPRYVGAVWDAAHSALSGEIPEQALDIIWDKLCLINLKTAYPKRVNGPEAPEALFEPYFTTGRNGAVSWKDVAAAMTRRGYEGVICMPAEYTDGENVETYITQDIAYAKSLFGE